MNTCQGRFISLLIACGAAIPIAMPVLAQTSEMEEVVVTARKRDESFQDVPVTISVFTEATIENAGIQRPGDFIALVPNMTLVETQNAGNAFVVVRGISQARNSEPSVAVLVDGVLETNPAEFNQELFDIQQIEVLKGPQGALYGRNAIGGAIIIRTKDPSDEFEGRIKAGFGNGSSLRAQAGISGPVGGSDAHSFRASVNYYETDGYIPSTFLGGKVDPVEDLSARLRFLWKPSDAFTGDLRLGMSELSTRALYFVIPRDDELNPFSTFFTPPDANDVTSPIQIDDEGINDRDMFNAALKLDFSAGDGTVTSVSAFNTTEEILTGDAYDFRPAANSIFMALLGFDMNQSQYLDLETYSQEIRYTSPTEGRVRWIAGGYFVHTDRFISTGNMVNDGTGVFPVYREPRLTGNNPSATFLADTQDNDAWAVFANATFVVSDQFEVDTAVRYDEDKRSNTTNTPEAFLPIGTPPGSSGQVRSHTWSETQPKVTLRWQPSDAVTIFGGWSRGFRSGGFNQTGVGAVADANGIAGVNDLFEAEVADTTEVGVKAQFLDGGLNTSLAVFQTESENGYFFVFLAANSTQNLGNLDADYEGVELELSARVTDNLDLFASYGYTDSKITGMEDPSVIGNEAPLVSRNTANFGLQYRYPIGSSLHGTFRADYRHIGRTWWEPYNTTSRDPVDLVDARIGIEGERWSATAWGRNLTDEEYNAEFSPGGFLFRALPRRYGIEFGYRF
ncbi:MAG TPA: TonB-dependent receptor [Steroidobacteraceae bacterium]|nr:TonB-dependent receptor [Steroidobacteraceae bacterium]